MKRAIALAEGHPDRDALAGALNNLGVLYKYSGNFDEADRVYTRALGMTKQETERRFLERRLAEIRP